jgi:hypothetical protein
MANNDRHQRFQSHALVELRRLKFWPYFWVYSAVLLDISKGGFKLEFTGEHKVAQGESFWLTIPLQPFGIYSPKVFQAKVECRWFDEQRYRMGGTFNDLSTLDEHIIEQLIEAVHSNKKAVV